MVTTESPGRRTSLAEAVRTLDKAAETRLTCLGANGFWLVDGGVEPSLDHIRAIGGQASGRAQERVDREGDDRELAGGSIPFRNRVGDGFDGTSLPLLRSPHP